MKQKFLWPGGMKSLLTVMALVMSSMVGAQNVLQIEDISNPTDVYSSVNDEAAVVIRCNQTIPLSFNSTMDKEVNVFRTDIEGSDSIYYMEFPTGDRYRGRVISIISPGYATNYFSVELEPKQLRTFKVFDPNSMVDAGCYRTHRNKGVAEIKAMNYAEARNQFMLAKECSDVDTTENRINIEKVDSLTKWRAAADALYELLNYRDASFFYNKIVSLNPNDTYAIDRMNESATKFSTECNVFFSQAEAYYEEKDYAKARELYQKVVSRECNQAAVAADRITTIDRFTTARKVHASVLNYEWMNTAPIGFHYGRYNDRKFGGYVHLNINGEIFKLINGDTKIGQTPEINFGVGWTRKLANPVWIHFGPGVTVRGYYGEYPDKMFPDKDGNPPSAFPNGTDVESPKFNAGVSVNPEIGLTVKYSFFAARITYQYRFALKKDLKDFMGNNKIMLGIGFAF